VDQWPNTAAKIVYPDTFTYIKCCLQIPNLLIKSLHSCAPWDHISASLFNIKETDLLHSQGGRYRRQASCLWWWLCWALGPAGWGLWRSFLCGKHMIPWRAGRETPPTGPAGLPQGRRTEHTKHNRQVSMVLKPHQCHLQCHPTRLSKPWLSSLWRGRIRRAPPSSGGTRPRGASSARTPETKAREWTQRSSFKAWRQTSDEIRLVSVGRRSWTDWRKVFLCLSFLGVIGVICYFNQLHDMLWNLTQKSKSLVHGLTWIKPKWEFGLDVALCQSNSHQKTHRFLFIFTRNLNHNSVIRCHIWSL